MMGACPWVGRGDTGEKALALSRSSPVRAQWEWWKLPLIASLFPAKVRRKASVENKIESGRRSKERGDDCRKVH